MSETKSLVKKLALVMKEVKYIQKRGYNSFHKYKYATEADVAEKVREILAEQNVILIPNMTSHSVREHTTSKGNREYIVTVSMEFRFIDGDTGETITFNMTGEGQDSGDKGTYKAITGAQKYALMKAFLIPTGDDPEADEGADERNAAQKTNGKKEQEPSPALKAKWEMLAGTVDGFDEWYQKQRQNGASEKDMNNYLTLKITEKAKAKKGEAS